MGLADVDNDEEYFGTFDKWMREKDQIKKYGSAYALWRKQQLKEQIDRAASGARTPAQDSPQFQHSPFEGLPENVQAAIPPATVGADPQGTGMSQGTPQVAPAGRSQPQAGQGAPNLQDLSDEELRELYRQLGGQ